MTFKILKIFFSNIFSLGEFLEGFKKGPKGILKNVVILLAFLYCLVVFAGMYIVLMKNTYANLDFLGETELFPGFSLLLSVIIILNFGFVSVASSYFSGSGEEQFLALPIKPREFFGAKFGVSFFSDAIIGIFLFSVSAGVYGFNKGILGNPLFYIGTLVISVTFSIISVFLIYFLLIIVLILVPAFRKKSILTGVASVFIILFALFIGFSSGYLDSSSVIGEVNATTAAGSLAPFSGIMSALEKVSIFKFFAKALEGNILSIAILLLISVLIIFLINPLLGNLYIKTFEGASDVKTKRLSKNNADKLLSSETKKVSIMKSLYLRDVRGILREPTFFANGPLMVFLFPLIIILGLAIPFFISDINMSEVTGRISEALNNIPADLMNQIKYYLCFGGSAFALLIGNLSNVASSSFSREGKELFTLKAMPIDNKIIVKVKFLHAFTYIAIGYFIVALMMVVVLNLVKMPLSVLDIIYIFTIMAIVVFSFSALIAIMEMLLDTANPKLMWENPTAAFKQNMNILISMLITLVLFGGFIALGIFMPHKLLLLLIVGVIAAIITVPMWHYYLKYAVRKINLM